MTHWLSSTRRARTSSSREQLEASSSLGALPATELDVEFLEKADVAERLPHWRELAARQFDEASE
jgi:hypothetical protein